MIIPAPYTGAEPITANFGQNKSGMVSRSVVREIRRTADLNPPGFHRLPKNSGIRPVRKNLPRQRDRQSPSGPANRFFLLPLGPANYHSAWLNRLFGNRDVAGGTGHLLPLQGLPVSGRAGQTTANVGPDRDGTRNDPDRRGPGFPATNAAGGRGKTRRNSADPRA